jgi:hypothetical protein
VTASDRKAAGDGRFWLGGSPCARKSSVAALLAARHGLTHLEADRGSEARLAQMLRRSLPMATELDGLGTCDRLARPPRWQAQREIEHYREEFPLLLAEINAYPADRPVLVEGAGLLPELLQAIGVPTDRAIWLVPTPEFQLRYYSARDWVPDYLRQCADPRRAFDNWMQRDMLFARSIHGGSSNLRGKKDMIL